MRVDSKAIQITGGGWFAHRPLCAVFFLPKSRQLFYAATFDLFFIPLIFRFDDLDDPVAQHPVLPTVRKKVKPFEHIAPGRMRNNIRHLSTEGNGDSIAYK